MGQTLAANVVLRDVFLHPRQRQRTGWLCHRAHILEEVLHRRADSVAINGDDVVEIFLADAEGFIPDAFHRHAFGKQPDAREIHRMTGIQRRLQAGRVFRFHGNDFDLRHQLFDQHRDPCRQPAPTDRNKHPIEMGILLQQLQRQRALASNHHRMIEGRHPGKALLLRQIDGFGFRFVKIGTVEQHFAAKSAHRIDFNICRCHWHDDQGFQPQSRSRERHALGMVACGCRDHTTRFLLVGQPGHHRVGTAQFEAVYRLTVFTLHQNDVIQP